jgi:prolyl-tRNA synthetase
MRISKMLLPTLKEPPADADVVSQRLMTRAGMIRKVAAGIYNLLPLGLKVMRKVEGIVRSEMDAAGAQEILMPMVLPSELWKESGRWNVYGPELLRVRDRHGRDFCLGPTHEEAVTDIVRKDVRSYRDLPINLYQINTKFRDEIRPRFGLMRGREFVMKDAYSFHATDASAEEEYRNMYSTYRRIFERCGLDFRAVEAETGAIGGSFSHEFMVLADTGEDSIASCGSCEYAANVERAEIRPPEAVPPQAEAHARAPERVSTPGMKTVEDVSAFLKVPRDALIKTLIYETDKGVVAALVRGGHELNEMKLKRAIDASFARLADETKVREAASAPAGFVGPVGLKVRIIADYGVVGMASAVTGANEADAHLKNVRPDRDFVAEYADLRTAMEGDPCPRCNGALGIKRGIEVGHIFKLGDKYSSAMGATFLDETGKERPVIMGCYGIGIGRTAAAAIEQNHDQAGIIWPLAIAPFGCEVVPVNMADDATRKASEAVYEGLKEAGVEALLDDRDLRAGVKFKDSDLLGIPVRVTVGERNLKQGLVEIKERSRPDARLVRVEDAVAGVRVILGNVGVQMT